MFLLYVLDELFAVSDEQNSISCFVCFDQEICDIRRCISIEISRRFISDDKLWIRDQCTSDGYFLFFSTTEASRFDPSLVSHTYLLENLLGFLLCDEMIFMIHLQWIEYTLFDSLVSDQLIVLEDHTDFPSIVLYLLIRESREIFILVEDFFEFGDDLSHQYLDQRCFPGS